MCYAMVFWVMIQLTLEVINDVSDKLIASIFRVEEIQSWDSSSIYRKDWQKWLIKGRSGQSHSGCRKGDETQIWLRLGPQMLFCCSSYEYLCYHYA